MYGKVIQLHTHARTHVRIYPGEGLGVTRVLVFKGTYILFCIAAAPVYFLTSSVGGVPFSCSLSGVLMIAVLTRVRWNLIVVVICIAPLTLNLVEASLEMLFRHSFSWFVMKEKNMYV